MCGLLAVVANETREQLVKTASGEPAISKRKKLE
jgi:hypothetical protein